MTTTTENSLNSTNAANNEENTNATPIKRNRNKNLFERDKKAFYNDLLRFHENRGTPIARFPKISGWSKQIDLHQLYQSIVTRGGWLKVNSKNEWDEVLKEVGFPAKCVNNEIALKHIYIRYFDKYERCNFHGENVQEKVDEDDEENRHKKWSARSLHSVPQNYNYNHHNINESSRGNLKLSTDLYYASEYDKLVMSLLSPLPNEQDFAINVCTLMSNETKQMLKISKCPRLIFALLAHAGIFDHYAIREMFSEIYTKIRHHSQQAFWKDLLYEKPDILELLYEDYLDNEEVFLDPKRFGEFLQRDKDVDCKDVVEYGFLSLGRGMGTHEYMGQRILQIAAIIRNLSFHEENMTVLARNKSLMRFLILSANVRWNNLHHYGLDVIGNIALEIDLKDPFSDNISRQLFGTVSDGLESPDRGIIISCLEILSKFAQKERNEEFLCKYIRKQTYQQICLFLGITDMMLLIYSLECIYALTSIGEKPCNAIADIHGVLDTLVSLVTVDVHSFGPDSCILMRVVETLPNRMFQQQQQQQLQNIRQAPQPIQIQQSQTPPHPHQIQQTFVPHFPEQSRTPPKFAPSILESSSTPTKIESMTLVQKHNQQQILQENEQFALAWLKATFELSTNLLCRIEEQELYRMYIGASSKVGRKGVLSPMHFPRCVRSVFGGSVGPNPSKDDDKIFHYTGIKLRINAAERTTNVLIASTEATVNSQMKQEIILTGQPKNSPVLERIEMKPADALINGKPAATVSISSNSPLLQQVLTTNPGEKPNLLSTGPPSLVQSTTGNMGGLQIKPTITTTAQETTIPVPGLTQATTPTTASSLIKSLLANKVTTQETNTTASVNLVTTNASNVHQVAQRQLQQTKQKQLSDQLSNAVTTTAPTLIAGTSLPTKSLVVTANNQNLTNIKIGTSTISIKPGTLPNNTVITANPIPIEKHEGTTIIKTTTVEPPPLAPLSISSNKIAPPLDSTKLLVATSQKITANKMLVDLLDKKGHDPPPVFQSLTEKGTLKRKIDNHVDEVPAKKADTDNIVDANPNAKAADLYAKLAGSILEDEEMEEEETKIEKKVEPPKTPTPQIINTAAVPVQRQIIMTPNNQMILSPGAATQTATIKTDSGIQTVPILLQNNALQGIQGQFLQQPTIMQQQSAPSHYILATNNQGQTYVVAQQQAPQTVLLAQTPQQQGTPTKTIIILQQPQNQNNATIQQISGLNVSQQPQQQQHKIIMTPHGQQVFVTQVPRQFQTQQMIQGYQQTNVLPSNTSIIQGSSGKKIIITNTGNAVEVDPNKPGEAGQTQQIVKQITTSAGTKFIQAKQPQVIQQQLNSPGTSQIQTKIITQGTSQQIQALAQGQNIIVQKGQKFQIGNTQISQIIQPQTQIVQQPQSGNNQPQQQIQIIQKTIKVDQLQQQVMQNQNQVQQAIMQATSQSQILQTSQSNTITNSSGTAIVVSTASGTQVNTQSTTEVKLVAGTSIQQQLQQPPPLQLQPQQIIVTTSQQPMIFQQQSIQSNANNPNLIPVTIQQQIVTTTSQPTPISTPPVQQPEVSSSTINQPLQQQKPAEETQNKFDDQSSSAATSSKSFSIQIPVPPNAQGGAPQHTVKVIPAMDPNKVVDEEVDPSWPYVCDWRGCPKKKFASANEVYMHACAVHCPSLEGNHDMYCQWGSGATLCDNLPRKRFSLMTHIYDRHCTPESFKSAVQKRMAMADNPPAHKQPYPLTLVRMPIQTTPGSAASSSEALLQNGPTTIQNAGTAAMHAIKRQTSDFMNARELLDEQEGPVTKSVRLTAALIIRNLVNYSHSAKRALRYHESHLASIALSNVESSRTIAQVLYEMNDAHPV